MKYKLINRTTREETLCDKVTIDGFEYYVSDEIEDRNGKNAYINNDVYKNQLRIVTTAFGNENLKDCKKVIATNNPNIDVPKVVDEVEELAEKAWGNSLATKGHRIGFKYGYNKSQETHPFSEEDMIEFAEWKDYNFYQHIEDNLYRTMQARPMYKVLENKSYTTKELLQLWKEQKIKIVYYDND